jgi:hypothetical protein
MKLLEKNENLSHIRIFTSACTYPTTSILFSWYEMQIVAKSVSFHNSPLSLSKRSLQKWISSLVSENKVTQHFSGSSKLIFCEQVAIAR